MHMIFSDDVQQIMRMVLLFCTISGDSSDTVRIKASS